MGALKAKDSLTLFIYKASKYDNNENHPDDCMSLDKCSLMNHIIRVLLLIKFLVINTHCQDLIHVRYIMKSKFVRVEHVFTGL